MSFTLVALSTFLGVSAGALAPRQSATPAYYYTPNYSCPPDPFFLGGAFYNIDISDMSQGYVECYTEDVTCNHNLNDGGLWDSQPSSCPASIADYSAPCGPQCPDYESGTVAADPLSYITAYAYTWLACTYQNSGDTCSYDSSTGGFLSSASDPGCDQYSYAPSTCPGYFRRRYRGEDNFTAMLKKKALAEAPLPS
uniref:Uncharacterized protein n=1 Tax=Mycena chlorophos TaxID=658473 RepID=A0ABQ0LID2_MYCCL|nr:predicted protein [Mycena chlorophos]